MHPGKKGMGAEIVPCVGVGAAKTRKHRRQSKTRSSYNIHRPILVTRFCQLGPVSRFLQLPNGASPAEEQLYKHMSP